MIFIKFMVDKQILKRKGISNNSCLHYRNISYLTKLKKKEKNK